MAKTETTPVFEIGTVVRLKSDPNRLLTVLGPYVYEELGIGVDSLQVGHFTDAGEFEECVLPVAALEVA